MLESYLKKVKLAQNSLVKLNGNSRNIALKKIAINILNNSSYILEENNKDIDNAIKNNLKESMVERLRLTEEKIKEIVDSIYSLIELDDYVNKTIEQTKRPNGLIIKKVYVPFGVIGAIFESRPNVVIDIVCLCLKTANACVLKGGKEALNTNIALVNIMKDAIKDIVSKDVIYLITDSDRKTTDELLTKREFIDLLIPRGSKSLIDYVVSNSKIPYIETGAGNCHLYVNEKADIDMAIKIAINAKYQRPSVCNSIENILVDEKIAPAFLKKLYFEFKKLNIEMRGDEKTLKIIDVNLASDIDFDTEYNDYIISIKIVKNISEAIDHINLHSTHHSETIVTEDDNYAIKFLNEIDSACVYHNASTRFSDGGCFGFGAELGISTQKLHARGPMGLKEMMSYKYIILGKGQVR